MNCTTLLNELICIRPARRTDAERLADAAGKIFWETFAGTMPDKDLADYIAKAFHPDTISAELSDPKIRFLLAFSNDQLIGYAKLTTHEPPAGVGPGPAMGMDRLYVFAGWHNRKVGASLLGESLKMALEQGYKIMWLNVWERNERAIRFYRSWGFRQVGARILMRGNEAQLGLDMQKYLG